MILSVDVSAVTFRAEQMKSRPTAVTSASTLYTLPFVSLQATAPPNVPAVTETMTLSPAATPPTGTLMVRLVLPAFESVAVPIVFTKLMLGGGGGGLGVADSSPLTAPDPTVFLA